MLPSRSRGMAAEALGTGFLQDLFEVISTNAASQRLVARLLGDGLVQQLISRVPVQFKRSRL
jgi:hypothetical protein